MYQNWGLCVFLEKLFNIVSTDPEVICFCLSSHLHDTRGAMALRVKLDYYLAKGFIINPFLTGDILYVLENQAKFDAKLNVNLNEEFVGHISAMKTGLLDK